MIFTTRLEKDGNHMKSWWSIDCAAIVSLSKQKEKASKSTFSVYESWNQNGKKLPWFFNISNDWKTRICNVNMSPISKHNRKLETWMIVISLIPQNRSQNRSQKKQQVLREIRKAQGFGAEQPARYQLLGEKMDPEKDELSKADHVFPSVSRNSYLLQSWELTDIENPQT